jgi:hypothetical protein
MKKNPLLSRKLITSLIGIGMVYGAYWHSVHVLNGLEQAWQATAFVSITQSRDYTIAAIVLFYVGVTGALSGWTHKTEAVAQAVLNVAVDPAVVRKYADLYKGEPSYRPVDELA